MNIDEHSTFLFLFLSVFLSSTLLCYEVTINHQPNMMPSTVYSLQGDRQNGYLRDI